MQALLILPSVALAVLGAHFYRAGVWPAVLACVALLGLMLLWRRPWVPRLLQLGLALGTAEWLWTTFLLAQQRLALGQPWLRMALILLAVALFTAASAAVLGQRRVRERYC
jgi:peptidoglycan/LPS O-acetylase OafA/YrhL